MFLFDADQFLCCAESCIGGFGMSITGTLFVLISLFRYRFVARLIEAAKVFNDLERTISLTNEKKWME